MCMCEKPNKNGQPGFSWDGKKVGIRPVDPPAMGDGDVLLFDEPGRCGGLDSHCHHFRVVRDRYGHICVLVRNGGGDERITHFTNKAQIERSLGMLDSDGRYWLLCSLYHVKEDAARAAEERVSSRWRKAAAEKRIKTRKTSNGTKVWLEEPTVWLEEPTGEPK